MVCAEPPCVEISSEFAVELAASATALISVTFVTIFVLEVITETCCFVYEWVDFSFDWYYQDVKLWENKLYTDLNIEIAYFIESNPNLFWSHYILPRFDSDHTYTYDEIRHEIANSKKRGRYCYLAHKIPDDEINCWNNLKNTGNYIIKKSIKTKPTFYLFRIKPNMIGSGIC